MHARNTLLSVLFACSAAALPAQEEGEAKVRHRRSLEGAQDDLATHLSAAKSFEQSTGFV